MLTAFSKGYQQESPKENECGEGNLQTDPKPGKEDDGDDDDEVKQVN